MPINLLNNNVGIDAYNSSITFNGPITGNAVFNPTGGLIILGTANSYRGMTYLLDSGVLRLSNPQAIPGGIGVSGGSANIDLLSGVLELGAGDFDRSVGTGASQVQFGPYGPGFSAYGANRIVNLGGASALLTWGSGAFVPNMNTPTLTLGSPTANAMVDFQNPMNLALSVCTINVNRGSAAVDGQLSGALSGSGQLAKTGSGTLLLATVNSYSGGTVVSGGILRQGVAGAIPNGVLWLSGGTADLNGFNYTANALGDPPFNPYPNPYTVALGGATLTVNNSAASAFSGTISGAGNLLKYGAGTLALNGANTYSGNTTVYAGTLLLGNSFSLPGGAGSSGGTGNLTISGGVVELSASDFLYGLGSGPGQVQFTSSGGFSACAPQILPTSMSTWVAPTPRSRGAAAASCPPIRP